MPFASSFLRGVERGRSVKERRIAEQFQQEDRDIEKELLQHRLRELKINERMRARTIALQNLSGQEGVREADAGGMLEGISSRSLAGAMGPGGDVEATPEVQMPLPLREIDIPGVPELGVEGFSRRPETFEQQLARMLATRRMDSIVKAEEAAMTPTTVPAGASIVVPGQAGADDRGVIFQSPNRARGLQFDEAMVNGQRTFVQMDPDTGAMTDMEGNDVSGIATPIPPASLISLGDRAEDAGAIADGIRSGIISPILDGMDRVTRTKVTTNLARGSGFNLRAAQNDARALRAHIGTMNSQQFANFRAHAANASALLDEVEALNQDISNRFGVRSVNRVTLDAARRGVGVDAEQQQIATDFTTAIGALQESLSAIAAGGSAPTNAALERAVETLSSDFSQSQLSSTIRSLRTHLTRRTGSLVGLEPILPSAAQTSTTPAQSQLGGPTADQVAAALAADGRPSDPATVEAVLNSPEALELLLGR